MSHSTNPLLTALLLVVVALAPLQAGARGGPDEQVESLHREIMALRIVAALEPSEEQVEALIPLVEDGVGLVDDLQAVHEENQRASVAVLRAVRDDLASGGEVREATRAAMEDHHEQCHQAMRPVHEELKLLTEEVLAVLDEDQRARIVEALDKTGFERRAERRARREGDDARPIPGLDLPPEAQRELRHHNLRKLFGLIYSEEFLATLRAS